MIDEQLRKAIEEDTEKQCFLLEVEAAARKPYYLIDILASPPYESSMGHMAVSGDMIFQINSIGVNADHLIALERRLIESLGTSWKRIVGAMGPPEIRRNGAGRQDDVTYRGILIATYKVSIA